MPVPWEALLQFGVIATFFVAGGAMGSAVKYWDNEWQPPRTRLDKWDRDMMERDKRLSNGHKRLQSDGDTANEQYSSSTWTLLEKQTKYPF